MSSTIQVRVEDDLKTKSDELFRSLGTDTTSAIRMFLTQAVINEGFPFEITAKKANTPYMPATEEKLLSRLKTSRDHADDGRYKSADDVIADMRDKYGI